MELLHAFHLLKADDIDEQLLSRFFKTIIRGKKLEQWTENINFLKKANFNTNAWIEGFESQISEWKIYTEKDPLEALKMGNYFGTCLSLDGVMNAYSALVNVVDVNKHVIYARTKKGAVVARKLIAIDKKGGCLGIKPIFNTILKKSSNLFF